MKGTIDIDRPSNVSSMYMTRARGRDQPVLVLETLYADCRGIARRMIDVSSNRVDPTHGSPRDWHCICCMNETMTVALYSAFQVNQNVDVSGSVWHCAGWLVHRRRTTAGGLWLWRGEQSVLVFAFLFCSLFFFSFPWSFFFPLPLKEARGTWNHVYRGPIT